MMEWNDILALKQYLKDVAGGEPEPEDLKGTTKPRKESNVSPSISQKSFLKKKRKVNKSLLIGSLLFCYRYNLIFNIKYL